MKRVIDIGGAIVLLILLGPVLLVTALLVRWKLGAPVLFAHERPGLHGKPFRLLKFRSMLDTRDENGDLLPDEQRVSAFGTSLRKTSLDELPALLNVLKGDISFVGPRPLLMRYLPCYSEQESRRHDVKPGITGLAQVNGRNSLNWEQVFEFDLYYVQHCSIWLDIKILLQTVGTVVSRKGITDTNRVIGREPLDIARKRQNAAANSNSADSDKT